MDKHTFAIRIAHRASAFLLSALAFSACATPQSAVIVVDLNKTKPPIYEIYGTPKIFTDTNLSFRFKDFTSTEPYHMGVNYLKRGKNADASAVSGSGITPFLRAPIQKAPATPQFEISAIDGEYFIAALKKGDVSSSGLPKSPDPEFTATVGPEVVWRGYFPIKSSDRYHFFTGVGSAAGHAHTMLSVRLWAREFLAAPPEEHPNGFWAKTSGALKWSWNAVGGPAWGLVAGLPAPLPSGTNGTVDTGFLVGIGISPFQTDYATLVVGDFYAPRVNNQGAWSNHLYLGIHLSSALFELLKAEKPTRPDDKQAQPPKSDKPG